MHTIREKEKGRKHCVCYGVGATEYNAKPLEADELVDAVVRLVNGSS